MGEKKKYSKPEISRIQLDNTITLMMLSNPGPRRGTAGTNTPKPANSPFASPFGDKPFK